MDSISSSVNPLYSNSPSDVQGAAFKKSLSRISSDVSNLNIPGENKAKINNIIINFNREVNATLNKNLNPQEFKARLEETYGRLFKQISNLKVLNKSDFSEIKNEFGKKFYSEVGKILDQRISDLEKSIDDLCPDNTTKSIILNTPAKDLAFVEDPTKEPPSAMGLSANPKIMKDLGLPPNSFLKPEKELEINKAIEKMSDYYTMDTIGQIHNLSTELEKLKKERSAIDNNMRVEDVKDDIQEKFFTQSRGRN